MGVQEPKGGVVYQQHDRNQIKRETLLLGCLPLVSQLMQFQGGRGWYWGFLTLCHINEHGFPLPFSHSGWWLCSLYRKPPDGLMLPGTFPFVQPHPCVNLSYLLCFRTSAGSIFLSDQLQSLKLPTHSFDSTNSCLSTNKVPLKLDKFMQMCCWSTQEVFINYIYVGYFQ